MSELKGPLHQEWTRETTGEWRTAVDGVSYCIFNVRPFYRLHVSTESNTTMYLSHFDAMSAAQRHYEQHVKVAKESASEIPASEKPLSLSDQLDALRAERVRIEMSDDMCYTNGSIAAIDREITRLEKQKKESA